VDNDELYSMNEFNGAVAVILKRLRVRPARSRIALATETDKRQHIAAFVVDVPSRLRTIKYR
jgi:hypothetical protein